MEQATKNTKRAAKIKDFNFLHFYLPELKDPTPEQEAEYEAARAQRFDFTAYDLVKSFFSIDAKRAAQNKPGHNHNVIDLSVVLLIAYNAGKNAGIKQERAERKAKGTR